METLKEAKADYDNAIQNCKFMKGTGPHTKESKAYLARAKKETIYKVFDRCC